MIREAVSLDDVITLLNEAVALDAAGMCALVETRVPVNGPLAAHPTIQVAEDKLGLLGILNGIFGTDDRGWGAIAARFEADGSLVGFERRC